MSADHHAALFATLTIGTAVVSLRHCCTSHEHSKMFAAPHFSMHMRGTLHTVGPVSPPPVVGAPSLVAPLALVPGGSVPDSPPLALVGGVENVPVASVFVAVLAVVGAPERAVDVGESGSTPPTTKGAGALHAATEHVGSLVQSAYASSLIESQGGCDLSGTQLA